MSHLALYVTRDNWLDICYKLVGQAGHVTFHSHVRHTETCTRTVLHNIILSGTIACRTVLWNYLKTRVLQVGSTIRQLGPILTRIDFTRFGFCPISYNKCSDLKSDELMAVDCELGGGTQ